MVFSKINKHGSNQFKFSVVSPLCLVNELFKFWNHTRGRLSGEFFLELTKMVQNQSKFTRIVPLGVRRKTCKFCYHTRVGITWIFLESTKVVKLSSNFQALFFE